MGVYAFRPGPTYRAATPTEQMSAALDMPLSLTSTLGQSFKGGILDSLGLGTAIREGSLPEEAPATPTVTTQGPDGETITLPDTPQMRRRATVQGFELQRETQQQLDERRRDVGAMDEGQYKSSAYFRDGVKWDAGMTQDRAAALAEAYDAKRVREYFGSKRPITSFIGNLAGQAVDPINYIPIAGPAVKAANIARFGRLAGTAATGAIDASLNTAIASGVTYDARQSMGDEITWQSTISDIAMSALIGGAFGAIGGAVEGRRAAKLDAAKKVANERLSTLRNVQDARIALNDAIGGLARGEDIALGGNAVDAAQRMSDEVHQLSRAYDDVLANPNGPVRDPLVQIIPDDIEGMIVARGAFKDVNEIEFSKRGWGLVKVIWGHGDQSKVAPEFRVSKADITNLPNVVREYEPSSISADGLRREWRVERDGRTAVYADTMMGDEGRHLVTAYIDEPNPGKTAPPLSKKRPAVSPGSHPQAGDLVGDTVGDRSIGTPEAGRDVTGSSDEPLKPVGDTADQALPSFDQGQTLPATKNVARPNAVDNTVPKPEPLPAGKVEAESRVGTPDTIKAMSEQYRVNPADGSFIEQADVEQVRKEGRITPEDDMLMNEAQKGYDDGVAFGEALKAAASCMI